MTVNFNSRGIKTAHTRWLFVALVGLFAQTASAKKAADTNAHTSAEQHGASSGAWLWPLTPKSRVPAAHTQWSNGTALTTAPRRIEVGLLSESSYAYSSRIELRLHPLAFFALPHAAIKVRWPSASTWQFSSLHRLSYPSLFLSLVSRSGTGGLLPSTDKTPQALLVDNDVLASRQWIPRQWLTARFGFSVATPGSDRGTLLDFPYLYPRMAALHAPWVPHAGLNLTGNFSKQWGYETQAQIYWLPLPDSPVFEARELQTSLNFWPNRRHQLSLRARFSHTKYAIGWRSNILPHIDYRIAW